MRLALSAVYLAAIVAANLVTAHYAAEGHPEASLVTAFALVGLDVVVRDVLHDTLRGVRRWSWLGALVLAGSGLSYLANPDSAAVAQASAIAFAAMMAADTAAYHALRRLPWVERSGISNVCGAAVDSAVFVALAFDGPFLFWIAFGQFTAKAAGGFLWAVLLERVVPVGAHPR